MREEMERIKEEFNTAAMTTLGGAMVRNQDGNPRQQMQFSRVTKIEFPIFVREDVRGLLYKCEQFFSVDHIADDQKNVKYKYNMENYQNAYDKLLSRVEVLEEQSVSFC
ncbi:hypothetical protein Tco_1445026 [Tanacetum coccineum]